MGVFFNINWYFTEALSCIGMKENLSLFTNFTYFLNWLDHTNFIIDHNCRNKQSIIPDISLQILQIDKASLLLHLQIRHRVALLLQVTACIKDALMINLSSDNMFLALVFIERCNTLKCQVIRFRGPTRKNNLLR